MLSLWIWRGHFCACLCPKYKTKRQEAGEMQLEICDLTKRYAEKTAVDHLSIRLKNGVYGLLGANGAGKTTLMRLICGLMQPTEGEIFFNEREIHLMGEQYRKVLGFLPQNFGYYPEFTAWDFLLYVAAVKGLEDKKGKEKAAELLEKVGLKKEAKRRIKTYSGGMKQRLGIAQAMLNDPRILILDEPTAGLDPKERVRFRNLISAFSKDRIVLLSTHIVSDVEYIAEKVILMKGGKLLHFGAGEEITAKMEGKVWECIVPSSMAQKYTEQFNTGNIKNLEDNRTVLRIISEEMPLQGAKPASPNLEDLYLYYFKGESER